MAGLATPDRTGPDYTVLADAAENVSPIFPFYICQNNGYFESVTLGVGESFEVTFIPDRAYDDSNNSRLGWSHFFIWCVALNSKPLLVGPTEMEYWADTAADASANAGVTADPYREGQRYRLRLTYTDVDTLTTTLWEDGVGGDGTSSTLTTTNLFNDGDPVFYIGALPDAHLALPVVLAEGRYVQSCPGLVITKAPDAGNLGPTDVTIDNATIAAGDTGEDVYIGQFSTVHASENGNFLYTLVAGTGDTDNASYTLSEDGKLYTAAVLTAGGDSIRVQTKDKYGLTYEEAVTITIS